MHFYKHGLLIPALFAFFHNNFSHKVTSSANAKIDGVYRTLTKKLGILDMINFCDYRSTRGKIATDYKIGYIPANYLIDEHGKIVSKKETIAGLTDDL